MGTRNRRSNLGIQYFRGLELESVIVCVIAPVGAEHAAPLRGTCGGVPQDLNQSKLKSKRKHMHQPAGDGFENCGVVERRGVTAEGGTNGNTE